MRDQTSSILLTVVVFTSLVVTCDSSRAQPASQPATRPAKPPATSPTTREIIGPLSVVESDAILANLGKPAIVTGVVFRAQLSSTGKVFRIEFARASGFNAVIFERNLKSFTSFFGSDLSATFTGKTVELTGTLEEYRGNPQIILSHPQQLRIVP